MLQTKSLMLWSNTHWDAGGHVVAPDFPWSNTIDLKQTQIQMAHCDCTWKYWRNLTLWKVMISLCLWPARGSSFRHWMGDRAEYLTKPVVKGLNKVLGRRLTEKHDLMIEARMIFFRWIHLRGAWRSKPPQQRRWSELFFSQMYPTASLFGYIWAVTTLEISLTTSVTSLHSTIHLWQSAAKLA